MLNKVKLILIIISLIVFSVFLVMLRCSSTQITVLDRCLEMGKGGSWFGDDPVKDSAYIDKCSRYHRETLVDKYLFKVKRDKEGKIISRDLKKKKGETPFSNSEIMLYIESGHFQRR